MNYLPLLSAIITSFIILGQFAFQVVQQCSSKLKAREQLMHLSQDMAQKIDHAKRSVDIMFIPWSNKPLRYFQSI